MGLSKDRSETGSLDGEIDESPGNPSSVKRRFSSANDSISIRDEGENEDEESPKNSMGSLVVNNVGDLQYLGE